MNKRLKRWSAIMSIVLLVNLLVPVGTFADTDEEEKVDIIVTYKDVVSESPDSRLSVYENEQTMKTLPIKTMTVPVSEVERLKEDPNVVSVSLDQPLQLMSDTRELGEHDWNNDMVKAFDAWDDGYTGKGVKVAVFDTGFDGHQDITYAGGHSVFEGEPYTHDHHGHGTHVAGIIGAREGTLHQGIAPDVQLYGVKVFSQEKGGNTSDLIAGIDWAIQEGMDIINMSLGYTNEVPAVHTAIKQAVAQEILVVAASGNGGKADGSGETIEYPAKYDEVIAVASVDKEMKRTNTSATGVENELAAPGHLIGGLAPGNKYVFMSGTSQATPHVTSLAAILMGKHPELSSQQIRALLVEQSLDLGSEGHDRLYGYGLAQYVSSTPPDEEENEESPAENPQEQPSDGKENEGSEDQGSTPPDEEENEESPAEVPQEQPSDGKENKGSENQGSTPPDEEENEESPAEVPQEQPSDGKENEGSEDQGSTPPDEEENEESPAEDPQEQPSDGKENEESKNPDSAPPAGEKEGKQTARVQVKPVNLGGVAIVSNADVASVLDNGTLVVFFDSALDDLTRLALTADQVKELKDRGITLVIAKHDLELVIPHGVFKAGDVVIEFERVVGKGIPYAGQAKSTVYQFKIIQNGQQVRHFDEEIEMGFRVDQEKNVNNLKIYYWNESLNEWEKIGGNYQEGFIVARTNHFSTYTVFDSAVFEETKSGTPISGGKTNGNSTTEGTTNRGTSKNGTGSEPQAEESNEQNNKDGTLPKTATNLYNSLAIGALLLLIGFVLLRKSKRRIVE
ncbi:S8 family serine peptidase [Halalkalibacterium halodurans]|uniref:S8 family serine peptidase n=1 Tax=Halalkalibacterium halodurans TaxID=86665 RepID=UPI002E23A6EF|nr:S8 family serine peptidase [Halalkalibacterium halodurans]MED4084614.1 S8 family serine peptidase [Halalkalibacterium halodurans]MED4104822.1 S8 family serine peptidase [Halalkalibacterium halodurans]MED4109737.1 S8 family serine peptidase [Halalkalibacterium halodurans]MED4122973.1 S8 family serine peptidase [Halalkalibacterium halodurans]MED4147918.1 S8 family serine peptidase [Halalkalibacterium halodurans]